jgi:hypothetical protein
MWSPERNKSSGGFIGGGEEENGFGRVTARRVGNLWRRGGEMLSHDAFRRARSRTVLHLGFLEDQEAGTTLTYFIIWKDQRADGA